MHLESDPVDRHTARNEPCDELQRRRRLVPQPLDPEVVVVELGVRVCLMRQLKGLGNIAIAQLAIKDAVSIATVAVERLVDHVPGHDSPGIRIAKMGDHGLDVPRHGGAHRLRIGQLVHPTGKLAVPDQSVAPNDHLVLFGELDDSIGRSKVELRWLGFGPAPLHLVLGRDRVELARCQPRIARLLEPPLGHGEPDSNLRIAQSQRRVQARDRPSAPPTLGLIAGRERGASCSTLVPGGTRLGFLRGIGNGGLSYPATEPAQPHQSEDDDVLPARHGTLRSIDAGSRQLQQAGGQRFQVAHAIRALRDPNRRPKMKHAAACIAEAMRRRHACRRPAQEHRAAAGWSSVPALSSLAFLRRAGKNPAAMRFRTERDFELLGSTPAATLLPG